MYGVVVIVSWTPFGSHHCPLGKRVAKDNCREFKKSSCNEHAHVLGMQTGSPLIIFILMQIQDEERI